MQRPTKFNFFVPAEFSKSGETGEMKISGICSSKTKDSDGETLDPTGFDFAPLLEKGYFNWNHQANKTSSAILGRPTSAKVVNGGQDFYVEGVLYKGLEEARAVYNLAKTLKEEDPDRQLGFSIEGHATDRDPINPKRIRKATITGIAITHCPKNANTLLNIIKGEYQEPFIESKELEEVEVLNNDLEKSIDYKKATEQIKENHKDVEIEKSGEGSRGGKVIGHTKSGKPVYEATNTTRVKGSGGMLVAPRFGRNSFEKQHEGWTKEDHQDAINIFNTHMKGLSPSENFHNYGALGNHEGIVSEVTEKSMDTDSVPLPESVDGTPKPSLKEDQEKNLIKSKEDELEKGNAKQSERIVGKTKSGKEIYESTGHKSHYAFDKDDHEDAANSHLEEAGLLWKLGKKDEAFTAARRAENHKARAKKAKSGEKNVVKKSEIFDQIFKNYTQDIVKSEKIYKFIQSVNEKINTMTEITEDALSKAFELLDESIIKSTATEEKDSPADYDKKDELMKDKKSFDKAAEEDVKGQLAEGKKEDEICDDMMAKGYDMSETQTTVAKLCAEYTANKDGGEPIEVTVDGIKKSEVSGDLSKITESFEKSQNSLVESLDKKFSALTTILKSQMEDNISLKKSLSEMSEGYTKAFDELKKSMEAIDKSPFPRKSIANVSVLERFQKSEGADQRQLYKLGDYNDRVNLTNLIFAKATEAQQLGRPNPLLEKAVQDLEISKSLDSAMLPILNGWGIQIAE